MSVAQGERDRRAAAVKVAQVERDRAARLGRLAAKAGRGLGGACPYDANGTARQRTLAAVFVRAYLDAGGTLDGLDYGDGSSSTSTRPTSTRPTGRPYGHLGYLQ